MLSNFRYLIDEQMNKATSVNDLIPLLQCIDIGLERMKNIIKQRLNELNADRVQTVFYASSSIEDILPFDIIKHVISFNNSMDTKMVSTTFNKCSKQNNILAMKQRETEILCNIPFNKNNKTWIVDPTRNNLNDEEIKLGFNGPINDLKHALKACKSGDKILVHDGKYKFYDHQHFDKSIQIIGCGDNIDINLECSIQCKLYLNNLNINMEDQLNVTSDSTVWMKHCNISYCGGIAIFVRNKANFHAINCSFNSIDEDCGAIEILGDEGNVSLIHCMFNECGGYEHCPCISIKSNTQRMLKFIGNCFRNNCVCNVIGFSHTKFAQRIFSDNTVITPYSV